MQDSDGYARPIRTGGVIGLEQQRLPKARYRFRFMSLGAQRDSQIVMCLGKVGPESERRLVMENGVRSSVLRLQCVTEIVMCFCGFRHNAQDFAVASLRLRPAGRPAG